jgi:hypothetical protein
VIFWQEVLGLPARMSGAIDAGLPLIDINASMPIIGLCSSDVRGPINFR